MTSKPSDPTRHDFLVFDSPAGEFLIHRGQVHAGFSVDAGKKSIRGTRLYPVLYGDVPLAAVDFNRYLEGIRRPSGSADNERNFTVAAALVIPLSLFSEECRNRCRERIREADPVLSPDLMGMRISRRARVETVDLREIRRIPRSVRPCLEKNGFAGCRFPRSGGIQYLLDIERIMMNAMKPLEKQASDENTHC